MPSGEYTSTGGGLKLKGAKNAGVDKKRKKSKKDKSTTAGASTLTTAEKASETPEVEPKNASGSREDTQDEWESRERSTTSREPETRMKTEAERRHEEMRRKRVCFVPSKTQSQAFRPVFASSLSSTIY